MILADILYGEGLHNSNDLALGDWSRYEPRGFESNLTSRFRFGFNVRNMFCYIQMIMLLITVILQGRVMWSQVHLGILTLATL